MKYIEQEIKHGIQLRNDEFGVIVNHYTNKKTIFAQKNTPSINFPKKAELQDLKDLLTNTDVTCDIPTVGICCDGSVVESNPGPAESQVCDLHGNVLKLRHLGKGTNNYAELAGLADAVSHLINNPTKPQIIYTDSQTCLNWIESGKIGVSVTHNVIHLKAMLKFVRKYTNIISIRKWDTALWGEIPADFGRK
jgi:ribonuclease HI